MKKTLKEKIESLGLSYGKEITIIAVIPLVFVAGGVAIYFFTKELLLGAIVALAGVVLVFFYISKYSKLEKENEKEHLNELISLLSYFEIFIGNNNNVYTSFKMLLPYCSTYMDDAINSLLNQIDVDKSVGPYINFAAKFHSHVIESLMLSIYQMVDNGEGVDQFSEFNLLFSNIREKNQDDLIDAKRKSLESLNSFPLIGAGALTIVLSISIILIIGEYVNVI